MAVYYDTCIEFGYIVAQVNSQNYPINSQPVFQSRNRVYNTFDYCKIVFENCEIIQIPRNIIKYFVNITRIRIQNCKLQNLTKHDLAEYKNLKELFFENNKIEFLPGDLFEGFTDLERVTFEEPELKFVEPNILDGLNKLVYANFGINYRTDQYIYLTNPNEVKSLLYRKVATKIADYLMKYPMTPQTQGQNYKKLTELLIKLTTDLNINHEKKVQKCEKGIYADLKTFIEDDSTKDFCIQIDGHEFPVHKFLLKARSPTLADILKNNPEVENLNLVDISVEIFEKILKFLYTDELPKDDEANFLHLFAAAGKLKLKELKDYAANKIYEMIDTNNMLDALNLGNKYDDILMRQKCFEKIKEKYSKTELKDEWINDAEKVEKIIKFFKELEEKEENFKKLME